jgi:cytochrome c oxidase subunit 2
MHRWLPENVSTFGPKVDEIFYLIYYITGITFIGVMAALVAFLFLYRHQEGRRATYTHGNTTREIAWTIAPAVILVLLGFISKARWDEIKGPPPPADVNVRVTAMQFNWEILDPGADGQFDTPDDYQVLNDLHVPENVLCTCICAPRTSFTASSCRISASSRTPFPAERSTCGSKRPRPAGTMPCAELCGFGHSGMGSPLRRRSAGVRTMEEREVAASMRDAPALNVQTLKGVEKA